MSTTTSITATHSTQLLSSTLPVPAPVLVPSYGTFNAQLSPSTSFLVDTTNQSGIPKSKPRFNLLDSLTLLICLLCFVLSIIVVRQYKLLNYHFNQSQEVVAVVTLLGIENLCMIRLLQHFCLLLENRYGDSILHNYEGLLQWSPYVPNLDWAWRLAIVIIYVLPLVLNVVYNYFTGGYAVVVMPYEDMTCGPAPSPEMGIVDSNRKFYPTGTSILAVTVASFFSQVGSTKLPSRVDSYPHTYGFNTVLLSNTSVAALDVPMPDHLLRIRKTLSIGESIDVTGSVRATVVRHTPIDETTRADPLYWQQFFNFTTLHTSDTYSFDDTHSYFFGILAVQVAVNDSPEAWNGSIFHTGTFPVSRNYSTIPIPWDQQAQEGFARTALRFDARRHLCNATWTLTDTSLRLVAARCDKDPLPFKYQWMQNAQTFMLDKFDSLFRDWFQCFHRVDEGNCDTPWQIPIQAATIASAYQSTVADSQGDIHIQPGGPLWEMWEDDPDAIWRVVKDTGWRWLTERYHVAVSQAKLQPVLRDSWGLVWTLAIMPVITFLAFIAIIWQYDVPIGPGFGLVTLLAGVQRAGLDVLTGAGFSGKTARSIHIQFKTVAKRSLGGASDFIEYRLLGVKGNNDRLQRDVLYG